MMRRRRMLALAAGATLSGCGFQPVYMPTASGKAGVAQRELAAIQVDLIPDRPGQLLRQALQDRLEMGSSGVARRYELSVAFGISGEGIAIEQDTNVTRIREIGTATWSLVAQDPGRTRLTSGYAKSVDAINHLRCAVLSPPIWGTRRCSEGLPRRWRTRSRSSLRHSSTSRRLRADEAPGAARGGVPA